LTNQISMGHARALSKLEDIKQIIKLAHQIVEKQLSVRQIEELTKVEIKTNKIKRTIDPKYKVQEKQLGDILGQRIKIDDHKIVIYCKEEKLAETIERLLKK